MEITKALKIILSGKSVLFLVNFPSSEDLKDGYFQRVKSIDNILSDYNRIYVKYIIDHPAQVIFPTIYRIKDRVYEMRISERNPVHLLVLSIFALLTSKLYLHSIWNLHSKFHRILFMLTRKRVLDIHGAVPEELAFLGDIAGNMFFNTIERFAILHSNIIIGVTERMNNHIKRKHRINRDDNFIVLPIMSEMRDFEKGEKAFRLGSVIYCGGLQKWQEVGKMLEFVHKNKNRYEFAFLVPDPQKLNEQYENCYKDNFPGIVRSVDSKEVEAWYGRYAYGLVLREDIVVNNVASPTKLIGYFQNDVVPIVDSPNIGDFSDYGYAFVNYNEQLPSREKWEGMVKINRVVLKEIYKRYEIGKKELMEKYE